MALHAGGGFSWSRALPEGALGAEVGGVIGRVELAVSRVQFPAGSGSGRQPDHAWAFGAGYALIRTPGVIFGVRAMWQQTGYVITGMGASQPDDEGMRSFTFGLPVSFPVLVEPKGRVVPTFQPLIISRKGTGPCIPYDIGKCATRSSEGALGWSASLGIRADLPGPFRAVATPTVGYAEGSGFVRGVSLGLLMASHPRVPRAAP